MNKIILNGLKKRLDDKKDCWAEELGSAMVPLEIAEETGRVSGYSPEENNLHREDDVDLIYEVREKARMRHQATKELLAARYNKR
ncbi:hypothetical protein PIB30_003659 [Stylosanthes scabra]|uniref:Uncharacterized protein n=1 Tax=Stylosanthes scabra TaxID=79078 RepID=A0ABU6Z3X5_9FABA|nr:hypothetical protein [Stylosanthes scabra]